MYNLICSAECELHRIPFPPSIHLIQAKTADSAGKDGGKKKSKGAGDTGSISEVGDPGMRFSFRSSLLFLP